MRFKSFAAAVVAAPVLLLSAAAAQAGVVSVGNDTFGAVDQRSEIRTFAVTPADIGAGSGIVGGVSITIDFSKCASGVGPSGCIGGDGRPYANEIAFTLVSPDGLAVALVYNGTNRNGANDTFEMGNSNFDRIVMTFDDAGAPLGSLPAPGTFAPEESLAQFIGRQALGTWTLVFGDDVGSDPLGFHSATLRLEVDGTAAQVAAPAALPLFGAGLLGLAAVRRRRG